MLSPRHAAWTFLLPLFVVACSGADGGDDPADHHEQGEEEENVGTVSSALTATSPVSAAVSQSCSTTSVKALALQLVQEIQCLQPGSMKRIDNVSGLALGSAVFPYLQTPAANALVAAQKARGVTLSINSGLRTLPQQYLLYRWYQTGRCGIGLAAKPGNSNHESGIAVDINDNAAWRSAMSGKGFQWLGSSDPVHFDFRGGGTVSMKGLSVRAFQRLWNRNNPNDKIAEDGAYGPATEARLAKAPVGGFAEGAVCSPTMAAPMEEEAPSVGEPDDDFVPTPDATEPSVEPPSTERTTASATLPSSTDAVGTASQGCSVSRRSTPGPSLGMLALGLLGTGLVVRRRRGR